MKRGEDLKAARSYEEFVAKMNVANENGDNSKQATVATPRELAWIQAYDLERAQSHFAEGEATTAELKLLERSGTEVGRENFHLAHERMVEETEATLDALTGIK